MKRNYEWTIVLTLLLFLAISNGYTNTLWIEDFKNPVTGFDKTWTSPSLILGSGNVHFDSNGEIGRLWLESTPVAAMQIQLVDAFPWDTTVNRYAQMMIPSLEFGERLKVFVLSSVDGGQPRLIHDEWLEIPGQHDRPHTFDVNAYIPAGQQQLRFMIQFIDEPWGDPPPGASVSLDWVKAGMPSASAPAPGIPVFVSPADGVETVNPPTLQWQAPDGYTGNTYTVTYSKDPLFSDSSTRTVLDGVTGTFFTPPTPLSAGTWYWTVSATGTGGLSGKFLEKAPAPGDVRDPRNRRVYSFIIVEDEEGDRTFPHFPLRAASQGFGSYYRFTSEPVLVEQARVALEMGCDTYKFLLGWDLYQLTMYPDLPALPPHQKDTIVKLIQNEPAYQTVFNMPFKYYAMWTMAMGIPYWHFGDGLSQQMAQKEYDQIYELTRYLMMTYAGTGKVFLIGHWEGDWVLLEGYDYHGTPRASNIQGMKDWYRIRQQAVENARASLPEIQGVEVYHYAEVNIIQKAIDDPTRNIVANSVLPDVTVDLVSYSAYDATNHTAQLPGRLYQHLDYIQSNARFSGAWHYGRPVIIGEYGYGGTSSPARASRNLTALKAASSAGCPLILFWSIYSVNTDTPIAWVEPGGNKTLEYFQNRTFVGKSLILRNSRRVWLDRNPSELEMNQFASVFDTIQNSQIIRQAIDSDELRSSMSHHQFLLQQFQGILDSQDDQSDLFVSLLNQLEAGTLTRYESILAILDSNEFAAAYSDEEFEEYLAQHLLGQQSLDSPLQGTRFQWYEATLNREEFMEAEIPLRLLDQVTRDLRLKYQIDLNHFSQISSWEVY